MGAKLGPRVQSVADIARLVGYRAIFIDDGDNIRPPFAEYDLILSPYSPWSRG